MPKQDVAAILEEILNEADALIRQRLKEKGIDLPHLVIAVTPGGEVVLRSNVSANVLRSFGEDPKKRGRRTHHTTGAGRHDALAQVGSRSGAGAAGLSWSC